jgi:hypothetical protein
MSEIPETAPAFSAITRFLESRGLDYFPHAKENRVGFTLGSAQADYRFSIRITGALEHLEYIACCPFRIRKELRSSVAELIARANFGMLDGKFEIDMNDGEVRFHLVHALGDGELSVKMVERLYRACVFTLDRYIPAFMQHIHAGYTPEDAIFHAELDLQLERPANGPKPSKNAWANPETTTQPHPFDSTKGEAKTRPKKSPGGQDELPL